MSSPGVGPTGPENPGKTNPLKPAVGPTGPENPGTTKPAALEEAAADDVGPTGPENP